jgi:hypothetical protein
MEIRCGPRRSLVSIALPFALMLAGCSGGGGSTNGSAGASRPAPVVTPTSAYGPFPYVSAAQRATFRAFLSCAESHGLRYEGPFADSTGKGLYLRLAPGEHATHAEQDAVGNACPQFNVASFGTAVGDVRRAEFEQAADAFASCMRKHLDADYPRPRFGSGSAIAAFWRLPFDWSSGSFVDAVMTCIDPLKAYLFGGSA